MYDKKNSVLFTDTECVVLSPDFKITDESHVLLKVPRKDNMYSVDLKNVVPQEGLKTNIRQKDEKSSKNDKTEHGVEKHGKAKVKSKPKSTKVKVNPEKSTIKTGADTEEYLMCPPEPI
ncbi:hypothetical protein Tco_1036579 [Tanacetum coccineum]